MRNPEKKIPNRDQKHGINIVIFINITEMDDQLTRQQEENFHFKRKKEYTEIIMRHPWQKVMANPHTNIQNKQVHVRKHTKEE